MHEVIEATTSEQAVAAALAAAGSALVRVPDVDEVALRLLDELDAELVSGAEQLPSAVAARRAASADPADDPVLLEGPADLRRLAHRLDTARELLDRSAAAVRTRAQVAGGLTARTDAVQRAADDLRRARDESASAERALHAAIETATGQEPGAAAGDPATAAPSAMAIEQGTARRNRWPWWSASDRRARLRAVGVLGVAVAAGVAVSVVAGGLVGLLPLVVALGWLVLQARRGHDGGDGGDVLAAENLAAVVAVTERAYGGGGGDSQGPGESPEVLEARRRRVEADRRRARAEDDWVSLVGPDAEDVDAVLGDREVPTVPDDVVAATPTMAAARAHLRRLEARWKVVWWVLDRPVPVPGDLGEALGILEGQDVAQVRMLGPCRRDPETRPAVVVDEAAHVDPAELATMTSALPADVRIIVVAPPP